MAVNKKKKSAQKTRSRRLRKKAPAKDQTTMYILLSKPMGIRPAGSIACVEYKEGLKMIEQKLGIEQSRESADTDVAEKHETENES